MDTEYAHSKTELSVSRPTVPFISGVLVALAIGVATIISAGVASFSNAQAPKSADRAPSLPQAKSTPKTAPAPVPPDQIGIVDGIPILQVEWDRLAKPYYEEVEVRAGRPLNDEERKLLQRNVLAELVRERLWLADARRRGMKVSDVEIDARMKQSEFFKTAGQVDESKFQAFKRSPTSNYPELRAQAERGMLLEEYARWMERRFGPRETELRKTFEERTSQASLRYMVVGPDAISLEPEATAAQIRAYYETHPEEFENPPEARIQCVRVPANSEGAAPDADKESAARAALQTASDLLAGLRSGAAADSVAKPYGGIFDPGTFQIGEPVKGLGRSDALVAAVRGTPVGEWAREPIRIGPHFVLLRVAERRDTKRAPFQEVAAQAKRKADAALREAVTDSLARADVRDHPERYYVPRLTASWVARGLDSFDAGRAPNAKDVEKRLAKLRHDLRLPDTSRAWMDSARAGIPDLIRRERRLAAGVRIFRDIDSRLKKGEAPGRVASRYAATAGAATVYRGEPPTATLLVDGRLLDTLYTFRPNDVVGPRVKGDSIFAARVERIDPNYLPPYEALRPAARSAAIERRRQLAAQEAEGYYREHRESYKTPPRWVVDYVSFHRGKSEAVTVHEDSIAAYWRANPLEFTEPGKARVRHVLVAFRAADGAGAREAARQEALVARKRVLDGEDFGLVAREVSDDAGSSSKGGELGEVTRGSMVKEFGDVAFTVPVGELSEVFETRFGFHFLQVEGRKQDRLRPLADCREEIQGVLGRDLADSLAQRAARAFIAAASKPGASFDSLAKSYGGATRSKPLAASDQLDAAGGALWLERVIGPLPDHGVAPAPVAIQDGYLAVRRVREVPPEPATFEQVKERVIADYHTLRRRAIADSLDALLGKAYEAGADPESLFVAFGGLKVSRQFGRQGPIPDLARDPSLARDSTYLSRIFAAESGARLPPLRGSIGTLYAVVDTVSILPPTEFAKHRDELLHELVDERVDAWTARLRSKAPIRIHRKDLRALLS